MIKKLLFFFILFLSIFTVFNISNNITSNKKFIIYTTVSGLKIGKSISEMLTVLNYENKIVYNISLMDILLNFFNNNEYFIILFPHTVFLMPFNNKYIIYQLEQVKQSNWFTSPYKEKINNSYFTFDYSIENINNYNGINMNKIYYLPMPIETIFEPSDNNIYDIVFFGHKNERRINIINKLKSLNYNVFYENNIYGDKLYDIVKKSKIVLNIHFYKSAILEVARINEILKYNKLIISELPDKDDMKTKELYDMSVVFCNEINDDLSNINELTNLIDFYLIQDNYNNKIINNKKLIDTVYNNSFSHFKLVIDSYFK